MSWQKLVGGSLGKRTCVMLLHREENHLNTSMTAVSFMLSTRKMEAVCYP